MQTGVPRERSAPRALAADQRISMTEAEFQEVWRRTQEAASGDSDVNIASGIILFFTVTGIACIIKDRNASDHNFAYIGPAFLIIAALILAITWKCGLHERPNAIPRLESPRSVFARHLQDIRAEAQSNEEPASAPS